MTRMISEDINVERDAQSRVAYQRHTQRQSRLAVVLIATIFLASLYAVLTDKAATLPHATDAMSSAPLVDSENIKAPNQPGKS